MFSELFNRFIGRELPIKHLDKILIREYGVEESAASRISGYFIDGLKDLNLIDSANFIIQSNDPQLSESKPEVITDENKLPALPPSSHTSSATFELVSEDGFTVHIYGPGLNNKIEIKEEEDLLIVEAVLRKIKKAMASTT